MKDMRLNRVGICSIKFQSQDFMNPNGATDNPFRQWIILCERLI